jgi:hypothetical protein
LTDERTGKEQGEQTQRAERHDDRGRRFRSAQGGESSPQTASSRGD